MPYMIHLLFVFLTPTFGTAHSNSWMVELNPTCDALLTTPQNRTNPQILKPLNKAQLIEAPIGLFRVNLPLQSPQPEASIRETIEELM